MRPALKKLLAAAGIIAVLGTGALVLNKIFGTLCYIKAMTGYPCPGCGITRAIISAARGQFKNAFYWHPLFPLVPLLLTAMGFYSFSKKPLLRKISETTLIILSLAFIAVWILRLLNGWR